MDEKRPPRSCMTVKRRSILKRAAVTGGGLWGAGGAASTNAMAIDKYQPSSIESLLNSDSVQSIEEKVPALQILPSKARVTADHRNGRAIEVPCRQGTIQVAELWDGTVLAVFKFPNNVPNRNLISDTPVPDGAKGMLLGSPDGASLVRSASPEERKNIIQSLGLSDTGNIHISKQSGADFFTVSELHRTNKQVTQKAVRPVGPTGGFAGVDRPNFEVVSEFTVGPETIAMASDTLGDCDCGELVASVWLCFSTLEACSTAFSCAPFGGPTAVVACAVATGCIFGLVSEMLDSTGPGCVSLTQDLWNLCASQCVYNLDDPRPW